MPKNKAAQKLGSLGGKATAAKYPEPTDAQKQARSLNAKKALKARMDKSGPWHGECRDCEWRAWRTLSGDLLTYDQTCEAALSHRAETGHFAVRVKGFK